MTVASRRRQAALARERAVTLPVIRANAGLRVAYERKLTAAVDDMAGSVTYWLKARYRANEPEISQLAADASPAMELRRSLRKLARRWQSNFDKLAPELAEYFAKSAAERTDLQLKQMLANRGFTVPFKATAAQNDAYQAVIGENVALIKSIPQRYMQGVEGSVMRSVQAGRDLNALAQELGQGHGISVRRASFIARDQNNKATAVFNRTRQLEMGVVEAIWRHSSAGKKPRPEHVAFSGKRYEVAKGAFLEGKWTWPGVEIGCRCGCGSVLPWTAK